MFILSLKLFRRGLDLNSYSVAFIAITLTTNRPATLSRDSLHSLPHSQYILTEQFRAKVTKPANPASHVFQRLQSTNDTIPKTVGDAEARAGKNSLPFQRIAHRGPPKNQEPKTHQPPRIANEGGKKGSRNKTEKHVLLQSTNIYRSRCMTGVSCCKRCFLHPSGIA